MTEAAIFLDADLERKKLVRRNKVPMTIAMVEAYFFSLQILYVFIYIVDVIAAYPKASLQYIKRKHEINDQRKESLLGK